MGRRGPLAKKPPQLVAMPLDIDDSLLLPPTGLPSGAKRRYVQLAPILLEDGRLRLETQHTLAVYCRLADEAERIADALEKEGIVRQGPHGQIVDGRCKMLAGHRSTLLRYASVLGLEPTGRARLQSAGVIQSVQQTDAELEVLFG
jgi:P27 family predicted phage terminase small subunit